LSDFYHPITKKKGFLMSEKIRIMLVDDHAVVRSGLGAFLSVNPDLELVGEAENGEQAVVRANILKPDVILMDLMMPVMDGVTAIALIKKQNPAIQIIALTSFQEDELVQNALKGGAIGYLMKNVSARELAAAIKAARYGKMTLSSEAAQALVHASLLNDAIDLFNRARWIATLEKAKYFVLRRSHSLLDLESIPSRRILSQHHGGLKAVRLEQICGSLGRATDFDSRFLPLADRIRDRWVSIAVARSQNTPMEPVELIEVRNCYFVKNGHHRISVARARGETAIDAEITTWDVRGPLPWETRADRCAIPQTA
jgi:NarL family two-component system response regulator LiaR